MEKMVDDVTKKVGELTDIVGVITPKGRFFPITFPIALPTALSIAEGLGGARWERDARSITKPSHPL